MKVFRSAGTELGTEEAELEIESGTMSGSLSDIITTIDRLLIRTPCKLYQVQFCAITDTTGQTRHMVDFCIAAVSRTLTTYCKIE